MPQLFLIVLTVVIILLVYILINTLQDLLCSKKHLENIFILNKNSFHLNVEKEYNSISMSEMSEIGNQDVRETLLNDFPLVTYIFSGITGRGRYVNSEFVKLLGYNLEEVPTVLRCMQIIFPDENYRRYIQNEFKSRFKIALKTKTTFRPFEVNVSCKDGSIKCFSLGYVFNGKLKWYFGYDLTCCKKNVDSTISGECETNELSVNSNKILSIIAHDLRSPFNTILGCSELLFQNIKDIEDEEACKYSEIIKTTAENSLSLLDNLLNWSKLQAIQRNLYPQRIILSRVINEIVELYSSVAATKDIELDYHRSEDFEICTDLNMLKTILRNIVSNSVKFTRIGGKISIVANKDRERFEITIIDNGIGISKRNKNKLFKIETNKWTPGTSDEKGSGLGLPLCKEFMEKLGGRINIESKENVGSEFKLILPLTYKIVGGHTNNELVENS